MSSGTDASAASTDSLAKLAGARFPSAAGSGTVTAANAAGASQAVDIKAVLAAGAHDLAVSFLNDAWGGTAATDRNLHVRGVDLNGTPVPGAVSDLFSAGTAHFQIAVPA